MPDRNVYRTDDLPCHLERALVRESGRRLTRDRPGDRQLPPPPHGKYSDEPDSALAGRLCLF